MKFNLIASFLFLLYCFTSKQVFAQADTLSTYHSLSTCSYLSAKDHSVQIARFLPDRPCSLQGLRIHVSGATGTCKVHIFGHEGGTNFPWFSKDLIPPIELIKTQEGDTSITIYLSDSIKIENDQFYIAFSHFAGDFGIQQDSTYYEEFCTSKSGGNYYPSLLLDRDSAQWIGDNCHLAIDAFVTYVQPTMPMFKEVTEIVGLPTDISHHTAAWADLDNDYWADLLLGKRLFLNKAGTFQEVQLSLKNNKRNTIRNSAFIDMNNDGHWDILLLGNQKSWLLLNNGKGLFEQHGLSIPPLSALQAFSIADINHDQYPDLVLAQLWGKYPESMPNYLFLNTGSLDFKNSTQRLYPQSTEQYNFPGGIPCIAKIDSTYLPNQNRNRRSRATQFIDYDQDGDADLYIANYFLETDEFYENDGQGYFTLIPPPKPKQQSDTTSNHGTGIAWFDYDNDGDFDVLVPQLAHPRFMPNHDHRGTTLYQNNNSSFNDVTSSSGIQYEETHAGASFGDVNNDGLVDLLTTTYYGCRYVDLYLQQPDHTFQNSTHQSGFSKLATGSDVSFVDYNKDGKLDVVLAKDEAFRLFENTHPSHPVTSRHWINSPESNKPNNWLQLNINSSTYNHFSIGAIVKVYVNGQVYTQQVGAVKGQGLQSPTTLHFGLGKATVVDKVEIWMGKERLAVLWNLGVNTSYIVAGS